MTLDDCRRFYAQEVRFAANVKSAALIDAFATVPRENFLGPGPWQVGADNGLGVVKYNSTGDADPRHVYHNVLVALDATRNLNNGQPAALARWMDALELAAGDRVFHLGCGVGYYTAIMAVVVGSTGHVVASEVDPELGSCARTNLRPWRNVAVHIEDGATMDPGTCDAIFVNAGVTHALPLWLDRLPECGRLLLPLTFTTGANLGTGVMVKITRQPNGFSAQVVTFVAIYSCTSARNAQLEPLLAKALQTRTLLKLKSLRRDSHQQSDTCLVHAPGVCLSSAS